ncbi:MAG: NAD-dependent epimerase/dehydratase family protein, partial [Phycisphaerae bacterium]|nr:NAD-dependent epimerase/dehydratase family protein [Phycisphaerae bacterium]
PVRPISPYAAQKAIGETYCLAFYKSFGLQTVSLRYFNVFGPRQDPKSQYAAVIPKFITAMLAGREPTIYGDGKQSRDFSYIENVIHANLLAASAPETHGEAVNIACGAATDLLAMVAMLNEILGTDIHANHEPERAGDVKHSLADISHAHELIGYEPRVTFAEGLRMTVEWYKHNAPPGN